MVAARTTTTTSTTAGPTQEKTLSEIAYLTRALKAPTLRNSVTRLADRARAENWTYEQYLAACLQREVSARDSHGGKHTSAARFPARKDCAVAVLARPVFTFASLAVQAVLPDVPNPLLRHELILEALHALR